MELPEHNTLYFACIDLTGRTCLVVGGGGVALEKVEGLLGSGARVRVIAPDLTEELRALGDERRVAIARRDFRAADVDGAWLVIAATGDEVVDRKVAAAAEARGKLVNVADVPELCNFILPAIVRDGPIAVAVSTAGASPALAQRIKREITTLLDRPFGELAARLRSLRPWAKSTLPTYERRRDFFRSVVDAKPDPLDALAADRTDDLDRQIERLKEEASGP